MSKLPKVPIYITIRNGEDRSNMEDQLVLDDYDVSSFAKASDLWTAFQNRPARFIITDRRFGDDFGGLDLCKKIREKYLLPYVYIVVLSVMSRIKEIEEGLVVGVDDYLIKKFNPFQIRSRVLVGLRWLQYLDSILPQDKPANTKR
jgi:DNA-binding response OmpR family regulator